MPRIPLWKWMLVLGAVVVAAGFLTVPRPGSGASFPTANVKLGLDLQGGIHMEMKVRTDDAVATEMSAAEERVRQALRDAGVRYGRIERPQVSQILVTGVAAGDQAQVRELMREQLVQWSVTATGGGLVAEMGAQEESAIREQAITDVLSGIRDRVDQWGVAEPNIQRQGISGNDRILVQLPGVEDPERVKGLITEPAFLEWKLASYPPGTAPGSFIPAASREQLVAQFGGLLPDGTEIYEHPATGGDGLEFTSYWPLQTVSVITGNDLEDSQRTQDEFGKPAVSFRLDPTAAQRFTKLTRENTGRHMPILLDGKIISTPVIQSEIPGGQGIITGGPQGFTISEADDLSFKLRSGALRAGVDIMAQRGVGPSLGADSIRKGWVSGALGFGVVLVLMLAWYRASGINAVLVLLLNLVLILGVMAALRATLTLPGIAGYILTVGMAVDANVLIFERIREELRLGKTVRSAVNGGFARAFTTILDSNLTTLIAAVVLFSYGTGPIKGFAVTLTWGLLANMFTAVFVSRMMFDFHLGSQARVERLSI